MTRYDELLRLIDEHKPRTICEIGVWNGHNAIRMINQAKKHHANIEYTGYDLFEDMDSAMDTVEFNVKGHNHMRAVAAEIRGATGIVPKLVKGNTRTVLPETVADFVFLDGGHSVETIASDYARVLDSKIVVLDDYYTDGPDIERFGCNTLVAHIHNKQIQILPHKDPVKGGGFTQLVYVAR